MSSKLMKKYIDILMEALSYTSLQDAGDDYSPGNTQIWYWREDLGRDMMMGYDFLKKQNKLPNPENLQATHVLIGSIAETDLEKIYSMMQAESWSPSGESRDLINKSGVGHTSMSVGDIIVVNNDVTMVDRMGFVSLATGEEV